MLKNAEYMSMHVVRVMSFVRQGCSRLAQGNHYPDADDSGRLIATGWLGSFGEPSMCSLVGVAAVHTVNTWSCSTLVVLQPLCCQCGIH
jgi:hypothetical protein